MARFIPASFVARWKMRSHKRESSTSCVSCDLWFFQFRFCEMLRPSSLLPADGAKDTHIHTHTPRVRWREKFIDNQQVRERKREGVLRRNNCEVRSSKSSLLAIKPAVRSVRNLSDAIRVASAFLKVCKMNVIWKMFVGRMSVTLLKVILPLPLPLMFYLPFPSSLRD